MIKLIIINKSTEQAEDLKVTLGLYYFVQGCFNTYEKLIDNQDIKSKKTLTDIIIYCNKDVNELAQIKKEFKISKIIIYNDLDNDKLLFNAIQMGVMNFVHQSQKTNELIHVIALVTLGGCYISSNILSKFFNYIQDVNQIVLGKDRNNYETLSKRELMVFEQLLSGISYKVISSNLRISLDTTRKHISAIYKKLEIHSKGELYNLHYNVVSQSKQSNPFMPNKSHNFN
jgi:DNA-binding NarL/FixJ family response regulator